MAIPTLRKQTTTKPTNEWLIACMRADVALETTLDCKGCAAYIAIIMSLVRVRTNVFLKVVGLRKGGIAYVAFERFLARMHTDMALEICRYSRRVRAMRPGVQDHATGFRWGHDRRR